MSGTAMVQFRFDDPNVTGKWPRQPVDLCEPAYHGHQASDGGFEAAISSTV